MWGYTLEGKQHPSVVIHCILPTNESSFAINVVQKYMNLCAKERFDTQPPSGRFSFICLKIFLTKSFKRINYHPLLFVSE